MMSQAIPQLGPFPMPASFRPCLPNQALLIPTGLRSGPGRPLGPPGRRLAGSPDLSSRAPCEGDGQAPARACATGALPSRRTARKPEGDVALRMLATGSCPRRRTVRGFRHCRLGGFRSRSRGWRRWPAPWAWRASAPCRPTGARPVGRTGKPPSGVRRHACRAPVLAWRTASTQTAGRARAGPGARAFLHGRQPCRAAQGKGLESRWRPHRMDC